MVATVVKGDCLSWCICIPKLLQIFVLSAPSETFAKRLRTKTVASTQPQSTHVNIGCVRPWLILFLCFCFCSNDYGFICAGESIVSGYEMKLLM